MAAALSPYGPATFVLTDQSAILRFFPHRDGLITDNWNLTYSDSDFADWSYDHNFGSGTSSHRTVLEGAYVVVDWAGTAFWMHGESAGVFEAFIDGEAVPASPGNDPFDPNVLFNKTDLPYGLHTAILNVTEGEVSITGAYITVGLGPTETIPEVRNIYAVNNSTSPPTVNPLFVGDAADWSATTLYTNQTADGYSCLTTSTYGATLKFTLNETVGFMLIGSDDWTQGLFTVAVSSDTPGATSSVTDNTIQYSPRALWSQLNVPKYMATGLDRNATYTVEITNLGANFNLAIVAVYDAVSFPKPSASPSPSSTGSRPSGSQGSQSLSSSSSAASTTTTEVAASTSNAMKRRCAQTRMRLVGYLLLVLVAMLSY